MGQAQALAQPTMPRLPTFPCLAEETGVTTSNPWIPSDRPLTDLSVTRTEPTHYALIRSPPVKGLALEV